MRCSPVRVRPRVRARARVRVRARGRAGARVRARVAGLRVFRVAHVVQLAVDSNGGVAVAQLTEGVQVLALPRLLTERAHLLVRVRARVMGRVRVRGDRSLPSHVTGAFKVGDGADGADTHICRAS